MPVGQPGRNLCTQTGFVSAAAFNGELSITLASISANFHEDGAYFKTTCWTIKVKLVSNLTLLVLVKSFMYLLIMTCDRQQ